MDDPFKVLIKERILNTVYLGLFALGITLIVAIPIGIYSARNPYSLLDYGATTFGFFGLATPNFFFGLVAIYLLSINLGWFPAKEQYRLSVFQVLRNLKIEYII